MTAYFDTLKKAQKLYARTLEPVCRQWKLTRNELDILLFLYNNPGLNRAADIVCCRGIAKSHVSLSVTDLVSRGLLTRQFDPGDRRTALLFLTDGAIPAAEMGRAAQRDYFQRLFRGLTREEMELWRQSVQKIRDNIENLEE